ncbi:MAG: hypothetical protein WD271_17650 [Acidimicrobiia bacterium]
MNHRLGNTACAAVAIAVLLVVGMAIAVPAMAAVERQAGAGKPTPGSGMGTQAALTNPRCTVNERTAPYGRFTSTIVGGGPLCVKPWSDGDDNGGKTSRGITADRITIVAVVPNDQQIDIQAQQGGTPPVNRTDMSRGKYEDAVHDYLLAYMKYYETWGRDIEIKFVKSTGSDEQTQRADSVTVKAEKPFAVLDLTPVGLDVLEAEMAKAKILVYGYATTTKKALAQAPYRWGQTDAQSSAINAGEVLGKQLVGKKAEHAGDENLQGQTRKFGAVYIQDVIDIDQFKSYLEKYGGTLTTENSYRSNGSTIGDATLAQEQAPIIVTKMKNSGVTTVVLFTDVEMTKALLLQATKQEWNPEWFLTGAVYQDLAILARPYDQQQFAHAFGISNLSPWVVPAPAPPPPEKTLGTLTNTLNWYWGEGVATSSLTVPSFLIWVLSGVHTAGPNLTPKTFRQGLFAVPATGGAASGYPVGFMTGYGKNPGLPYDEYLQLGLDFAPVWWDPDTTGPSQAIGSEGQGVTWYVDGAKRYKSGTWPKTPFKWFDKTGSVVKFDTSPTPTATYAGPCEGCPSQGGTGQYGAPNTNGFVAKAAGGGEASLS